MIYNEPKKLKEKFSPFRIAWLFPDSTCDTNPSNRLRRYQLSDYFNSLGDFYPSESFRAGISGYLKDKPADMIGLLEKFDVVVIFNVAAYDAELVKLLKAKGKIVIFDHCENIFGLGAEDDIMRNVSAITCCSSFLAEKTESYLHSNLGIDKPIFVVSDPIDNSVISSRAKFFNSSWNPPKSWGNTALIMGMGANVQYVLPFLDGLCKKTGYDMLILTEEGFTFPYTTKVWNVDSWISYALQCTIALCYHDINQFPAKGNIKVTNPMSIGLPVIAPSMASYREAITDGYDGFIADTEEDWIKDMEALKDPDLRRTIGMRARYKVLTKYGMDKIALDYLSMIGYLKSSK